MAFIPTYPMHLSKFELLRLVSLCCFIIASSATSSVAQGRKQITYTKFIKSITSADTSVYRLSNVDIVSAVPIADVVREMKDVRWTNDSLVIVNRRISLYDCRFEGSLSFSNLHFNRGFSLNTSAWTNKDVYEDELYIFTLYDCRFSKGLSLSFEKRTGQAEPLLDMQGNVVDGGFSLIADNSNINVVNNVFNLESNNIAEEIHSSLNEAHDSITIVKKQTIQFFVSVEGRRFSFNRNVVNMSYKESEEFIPSYSGLVDLNTRLVEMTDNKFNSSVLSAAVNWKFDYSFQIGLKEQCRTFDFTNNNIEPDIFFGLGHDLDVLRFHHNRLRHVAFDPFRIPEQSNVFLWKDLSTVKLGLRTGEYGSSIPFYSGQTSEVSDTISFKELLKFYKKFYDEFKVAGDIQSANHVYIKIKDLETAELKSGYAKVPTFNVWFRVKLNQLLKYYTAYGTDPAQALVASFWIIFLFAVFYFFFPSTWDLSSKSRLVQDFRDFIEKNEKGYVKPFFRMLGGFFLSLLNAVTLSLNAFITLGFGEIPTTGAAKYIAVVQGFLGWFLLSIFTVSLVSQLLF